MRPLASPSNAQRQPGGIRTVCLIQDSLSEESHHGAFAPSDP